jgi:hypothetical protein
MVAAAEPASAAIRRRIVEAVKAIHLDEIEPMPIGDSLWKPIRSTLGINAFGINAYVADSAGATLFDEHDETEAGAGRQRHEELYFVVSGRAIFTVDGADVDAPAGTAVFVDDPAARRGARAEDPGTTVLAIGGPPGEAYEVAPWEYWFRVRQAIAHERHDEARVLAEEGLARFPDDARLQQVAREPP